MTPQPKLRIVVNPVFEPKPSPAEALRRQRRVMVLEDVSENPELRLLRTKSERYNDAMRALRILLKVSNVTLGELRSRDKPKLLSKARHQAMWLCSVIGGWSLPKTAEFFHRTDHTSIIYAIRKIESSNQRRASQRERFQKRYAKS
jgi:chromosomal replication initiation ATPase DnaA